MGQLVGASDFPLPNVFVKYSFEAGSNFRLLQGHTAGQTHCDMPQVRALCRVTACTAPYLLLLLIPNSFFLSRARSLRRWPVRSLTARLCTLPRTRTHHRRGRWRYSPIR